jgi:FixJ family two-component response regulator
VPAVVKAMRDGADDYLTKPFNPADLMVAIARTFERARSTQREADHATAARARCATLTPREREVVLLVVKGMLNKEIAAKLGLALVTVKVHRGNAMRKLTAGNPAELTRIVTLAGMVH